MKSYFKYLLLFVFVNSYSLTDRQICNMDFVEEVLCSSFKVNEPSFLYSSAISKDSIEVRDNFTQKVLYTFKHGNLATRFLTRAFDSNVHYIKSVNFSTNGRHALTVSNTTIRIWSMRTGALLKEVKHGLSWSTYKAYITTDEKYLVLVNNDYYTTFSPCKAWSIIL